MRVLRRARSELSSLVAASLTPPPYFPLNTPHWRLSECKDEQDVSTAHIGLFVVRRAVELLGHRIEISSASAEGSRFSLIAPPPHEKAMAIGMYILSVMAVIESTH